jgi:hypothetical protein
MKTEHFDKKLRRTMKEGLEGKKRGGRLYFCDNLMVVKYEWKIYLHSFFLRKKYFLHPECIFTAKKGDLSAEI